MVQLAGACSGKGLDRHVLSVGTPVVLDDSGFLDVAMAGAWWVAPEDRPVPVTELCGLAGSFVLLAADGTGKSTVLESLRGCAGSGRGEPARARQGAGTREAAGCRRERRTGLS